MVITNVNVIILKNLQFLNFKATTIIIVVANHPIFNLLTEFLFIIIMAYLHYSLCRLYLMDSMAIKDLFTFVLF